MLLLPPITEVPDDDRSSAFVVKAKAVSNTGKLLLGVLDTVVVVEEGAARRPNSRKLDASEPHRRELADFALLLFDMAADGADFNGSLEGSDVDDEFEGFLDTRDAADEGTFLRLPCLSAAAR